MKPEVLPARSYRLEILAGAAALASLVYAMSGCAGEYGNVLMLRPVGPEGWSAQVQEAADVWNEACTVFELGDAGVPVTLYERGWPGVATERGYWDGVEVAVRSTRPDIERATLVHELGHVLGLPHSDDYGSVMYPIVGDRYTPSAEEARFVETAFCGYP